MLPKEERVAARILIGELGLFNGLRAAMRVKKRESSGEPFEDLDPPQDEDERLSREQIGPAIVLYRVLQDFVDEDRAFEITKAVVIDAAVVFLQKQIGAIERATLASLDDEQREAWVRDKGSKFFNATVRWDEISGERVKFTVQSCTFPRLCAEAGEPQLAPLFCLGDAKFFGTVEENVELERPHTIAEGAHTCPFHIYWKDQAGEQD
jgi:hypothetical protein